MMNDKILQLKKMIDGCDNIVFFGGAGVSTESGIPDFRSPNGLYKQKYKYSPEYMLSHSFFEKEPKKFFTFYRDKVLSLDAKPNSAHLALAEIEKQGKLRAVVTQNVDGLHQAAGSKMVYELHGSVLRNYCQKCSKFYPVEAVASCDGVPLCECGGIIKPDVVLYEEGLDQEVIKGAVEAIKNAEMLIIGGTSLVVYPAAGLVQYYRGNKLVLINKGETQIDTQANLVINAKIGEVFKNLL